VALVTTPGLRGVLVLVALSQASGEYFPLKAGSRWTYENGEGREEVKTVGEKKEISGKEYWSISNAVPGLASKPTLVAVRPTGVYFYGEHNQVEVQWLPLPCKPGDKWKFSAPAGNVDSEAVAVEQVNVPAGKYTCLKVKSTIAASAGSLEITTWYALGVGEVQSEVVFKEGEDTKKLSRKLKKAELSE